MHLYKKAANVLRHMAEVSNLTLNIEVDTWVAVKQQYALI